MDRLQLQIKNILQHYSYKPANLIMILQDIQTEYSYLSAEAIKIVATQLNIPLSEIYSVASFYNSFSLTPRGIHNIDICEGTACHIRGASILMNQVSQELGVKPGETTVDGQISLNSVHCVGACSMGPVAVIDGKYHGNTSAKQVIKEISNNSIEEKDDDLTARESADKLLISKKLDDKKITSLPEYNFLRNRLLEERQADQKQIIVCCGTGCLARGSMAVASALSAELAKNGLKCPVHIGIKQVGCHGLCEEGPLVILKPDNICYVKVSSADAAMIVKETIINEQIIDRLLYREQDDQPAIDNYYHIPFYAGQTKIALRNVGIVNPLDLTDYIAHGGYNALFKVLFSMEPEQVIAEIENSGLRGRGGGGFPTGIKWRAAAQIDSTVRYVLCNGDEGDPGAFMDCSIMEGDPHSIIEGMIICAYAVNATEGYIYVRKEYPRAMKHLQTAIEQAYQAGLLGSGVGGTTFSFDIKLNRGAGAFVCGESTALMQSVEGKIGEPRAKYIRSAEKGLYEQPTVLNNVETFANIPYIIDHGAKEYALIGTTNNTGTKVFSVVGKVKNTGLVEVPLGTTLRTIIFDICGGIINDRPFKAVQTGGPSGGCLPDHKLDLSVDFDTLSREGSMMGSGGMIVMDDQTCMVDVARYFTNFLSEESCGKCSACRLGLDSLKNILNRICDGEGRTEDIKLIEELLLVLENASLCGLGKSAANPVRSTLTHFEDEYTAHITAKKCPAGVCRKLVTYEIDDACTGCHRCVKTCPQDAISGETNRKHIIDQQLCDHCGACRVVCNFDAITVK